MKREGIRLAIIGGCAASQKGMPLSRLYHRILSARWKEESGNRLRIILDRYEQNIEYAPRVKRCLERESVDAVLIHVRPSPYLFRCKPLVRYADASGRNRWALHPKLHPLAANAWDPSWDGATMMESGTQAANAYPAFKSSRLRGLHASLGMALGLGRWSRRQEMGNLTDASKLCKAYGKRLYILGPTPFLRSPAENRLCQELSFSLRRCFTGTDTVFIDTFWRDRKDVKSLFMPDLWHLSPEGHARLADTLFNSLRTSLIPF